MTLAGGPVAESAVFPGVNLQGRLADAEGKPLTGNFFAVFSIYDVNRGGTPIYQESRGMTVEDGLFSVILGVSSPLSADVFSGRVRYLGIKIGSDPEMSPRQPITSVPYAFVAENAATAGVAGDLDCAGCVGNPDMAKGSVSTRTLQSGAVTSVKLASASVTTNAIAGSAVTNDKLAPNSVEGSKIVDGSIGGADLAKNSVQPRNVSFTYAGSSTKGGKANDADTLDGLDSTDLALADHDHCWLELGVFTAVESVGIGSGCLSVNTVAADSDQISILYPSMVLGTDGLPIISYAWGRAVGLDFVDEELRVAHCDDLECSSATITIIDSAGEVGAWSSIAIGVDGLPVISYYDDTNEDLKVAHCNNVACTSATTTTAHSNGSVGRFSSIGIGGDGFPVISYADETDKYIRVLHCLNVTCTGASSAVIDSSEVFFHFGSLTIGSDGLPVVIYHSIPDSTFGSHLKVAHCANATCTGTTINVIDDDPIFHLIPGSVVIGPDGLPLISYNRSDAIKVARCDDVACASSRTATMDPEAGTFSYGHSVVVGPDGLPMIAYNSGSPSLSIAHCGDSSCTRALTVTLDHSFSNGISTVVSGSGDLIVSFRTDAGLKVARCHCDPTPDDN